MISIVFGFFGTPCTPTLFKEVGVISVPLSDHYPIYAVIRGPVIRPTKHRIVETRSWNDNKVNDFIAELKQAPWSMIDSFDDVDDMCLTWELLKKSMIDRHFPVKRKRIRKQTHPWLDSTVLKSTRDRDQVHKKAKKSGLMQDWDEYKNLRNKVTKLNRKTRKKYFRNKLEENRGRPKAFWNILRQVMSSKKNGNEIEIDKLVVDGKEINDRQVITNSLNEYFTTIAS